MRNWSSLGIALAFSALVIPALLFPVPPLLDYPNHLARLWLLSGGADQPPAIQHLRGRLVASLDQHRRGPTCRDAGACDRHAGAWSSTRCGGHRTAAARRGYAQSCRLRGWHWWQIGFAVLAWNTTLLAGFLSFQIGLGLALLCAALDPWLKRHAGRPAVFCVRAMLGAALLVWHAFAAGFYAVIIAGLALGADSRAFASGRDLVTAVSRAAVAAALAVALPAGIFMLAAPALPGEHAPPGVYDPWLSYSFPAKSAALISAFTTYHVIVDLASLLVLYIFARVMASRPLLRTHAGLLAAACGLTVISVLMPSPFAGTAFVDWRFPIMALLTGVAAVRPELRSARHVPVAVAALLLVSLARTAWVTAIWGERHADVTAVERALATVPPALPCCQRCNFLLPTLIAREADTRPSNWPRSCTTRPLPFRGGRPSCQRCSPPVGNNRCGSCRPGTP